MLDKNDLADQLTRINVASDWTYIKRKTQMDLLDYGYSLVAFLLMFWGLWKIAHVLGIMLFMFGFFLLYNKNEIFTHNIIPIFFDRNIGQTTTATNTIPIRVNKSE